MVVIVLGYALCCCTHPKVMANTVNKVFNWSEVHLSEVTSYQIHTLERGVGPTKKMTNYPPNFVSYTTFDTPNLYHLIFNLKTNRFPSLYILALSVSY